MKVPPISSFFWLNESSNGQETDWQEKMTELLTITWVFLDPESEDGVAAVCIRAEGRAVAGPRGPEGSHGESVSGQPVSAGSSRTAGEGPAHGAPPVSMVNYSFLRW